MGSRMPNHNTNRSHKTIKTALLRSPRLPKIREKQVVKWLSILLEFHLQTKMKKARSTNLWNKQVLKLWPNSSRSKWASLPWSKKAFLNMFLFRRIEASLPRNKPVLSNMLLLLRIEAETKKQTPVLICCSRTPSTFLTMSQRTSWKALMEEMIH